MPISQEWVRKSKVASVAPLVPSRATPRYPERPTPLSELGCKEGATVFAPSSSCIPSSYVVLIVVMKISQTYSMCGQISFSLKLGPSTKIAPQSHKHTELHLIPALLSRQCMGRIVLSNVPKPQNNLSQHCFGFLATMHDSVCSTYLQRPLRCHSGIIGQWL